MLSFIYRPELTVGDWYKLIALPLKDVLIMIINNFSQYYFVFLSDIDEPIEECVSFILYIKLFYCEVPAAELNIIDISWLP